MNLPTPSWSPTDELKRFSSEGYEIVYKNKTTIVPKQVIILLHQMIINKNEYFIKNLIN